MTRLAAIILCILTACGSEVRENAKVPTHDDSIRTVMAELRRRYESMIGRVVAHNIRGYNLNDTVGKTSYRTFHIRHEAVDTTCSYYVIEMLSGDLLCFEANRLAFVVPLSEHVPPDSIITRKGWQ